MSKPKNTAAAGGDYSVRLPKACLRTINFWQQDNGDYARGDMELIEKIIRVVVDVDGCFGNLNEHERMMMATNLYVIRDAINSFIDFKEEEANDE